MNGRFLYACGSLLLGCLVSFAPQLAFSKDTRDSEAHGSGSGQTSGVKYKALNPQSRVYEQIAEGGAASALIFTADQDCMFVKISRKIWTERRDHWFGKLKDKEKAEDAHEYVVCCPHNGCDWESELKYEDRGEAENYLKFFRHAELEHGDRLSYLGNMGAGQLYRLELERPAEDVGVQTGP